MPEAAKPSPRLYNEDIAPRSSKGNWKTLDLFAWWMSAWHSLGGYTMAVGLLVLGLQGWQMALGLSIGLVIIYVFSNWMGIAGQRVGVPFPVFSRISFGVYGANIPAILRAIVAVAWYGIQTYLASAAVMLLIFKLAPGTKSLSEPSFLGLSAIGWICFLALWAAQLAVLWRGMEAVRKLSDFAGVTIWVAMIALAVWVLDQAGWTIDWTYAEVDVPLSAGASITAVLGAIFLTVAYMGGPMLNFADFTRLAPNEDNVRKGNQLGLLLNGIAFCVVAVIIALASVEVYGSAVSDPVHLLASIDNVAMLLIAIIAVAIATVGINIILNFVSPAFDFSNVWPERISFRIGGLITAILSLLVMPWKLYANPIAVNYFIGGVGATMGPLLGIMLVDYYMVRKGVVKMSDLYSEDPQGRYYYDKGFNRKSIVCLAISGVVALAVAYLPALSALAHFSWPIGLAIGGGLCYLLKKDEREAARASEPAPVELAQDAN
ncbi:MAG TPA: NCS1 family nucleobase:cation symporter-1 [Arthrobacter sp.]|nr:NCS1 family nucleobase:cation symporter-1 [Nocardioidaceae bacterium]HET7414073.1 NCS1 family nucleobase:cation symporter-1 [Arthrobacter sp.]